jgi:hypothetical protein
MRYKPVIGLAALLCLLAGVASAATPVWWTPVRMAHGLQALKYPPSSLQVFTLTCKGATKARHGTYTGFRCVVTYIGHSTRTVWARPLAHGRVCASTRSLASCRPLAAGPLAGDPRVCSTGTPVACTARAAETAAAARWKAQTGYSQPAPTCTADSTFVYTCTAGAQTYTVSFVKGATAWTTTVTP